MFQKIHCFGNNQIQYWLGVPANFISVEELYKDSKNMYTHTVFDKFARLFQFNSLDPLSTLFMAVQPPFGLTSWAHSSSQCSGGPWLCSGRQQAARNCVLGFPEFEQPERAWTASHTPHATGAGVEKISRFFREGWTFKLFVVNNSTYYWANLGTTNGE